MKTFLFPVIILLGLIITYEDLRFGKIRNKWVLLGLVYGGTVYLSSILMGRETRIALPLLSNAILSLLVSYSLWYFRMWSAGDGKLFLLFSVLIPVNYYTFNYFRFFAGFNLLMNIFVPVGIVFLIMMTIYGMRHLSTIHLKALESVKAAIEKKEEYFYMFLGYWAVFLAARFSVDWLERTFNLSLGKKSFFIYMFLFLVYRYPWNALKKKAIDQLWAISLFCLVATALIYLRTNMISQLLSSSKSALFYMGTTLLMLKLIQFYVEHIETMTLKVRDVREGTLLTEKSIKILKERGMTEKLYPEGLLSEDVQKIKGCLQEDEELLAYKTIPYAPVAFIGVLLTLVYKTSVLHLILQALRNG